MSGYIPGPDVPAHRQSKATNWSLINFAMVWLIVEAVQTLVLLYAIGEHNACLR